MLSSWTKNERVDTLKIAIQSSKLLSDMAALPFYPTTFVLVTDLLDIFGKLIYDRLVAKAQEDAIAAGRSPDEISGGFSHESISPPTKDVSTAIKYPYPILCPHEILDASFHPSFHPFCTVLLYPS